MNSEFYKLLGDRIKNRRKELKLTQAALCGEYITRNMLSRIENGSAHPSMDTLIYISEQLKLPVEYFVSKDEQSAALYKRLEVISKIRSLFESEQYRKCVDLCESTGIDDSEINLIFAESELKLALECMMYSKLKSAEEHLDKCEYAAGKCVYNSDKIHASVHFYRTLIRSVKENKYPASLLFNESRIILVDEEFIIFVYLLTVYNQTGSIPSNSVLSVSNPVYKNFLQACEYISESNFENAKPYLLNVMAASPGFFTLYFTIQKLELCYKETDDFKKAYEYAKMRLELLDKFNN